MALGGRSPIRLPAKENQDFSLTDVVKVFNSPINEEQAWAVCYQCTQCFILGISEEGYADFYRDGGEALRICRDGSVAFDSRGSGKGPPPGLVGRAKAKGVRKNRPCRTEQKALETLGLSLFQALDYGLKDHEERHLSHSLETLIELMTTPEDDSGGDNQGCHSGDDEGIENDSEDEDEHCPSEVETRLRQIVKMCQDRLSSPQNAGQHYKAVCRALAAEVTELLSFLDKISGVEQKILLKECGADELTIDELERGDWARLWVQIMHELRHGVKLKKVEHTHACMPPLEYELTPYEVLMEDIRSRRYTLNKIMVNGDIPRQVKNDAHDLILDFIRSRPPLTPVRERVLSPAPPKTQNEREKLMDAIRQQPKLKPLPSPTPRHHHHGNHVESSRTAIFDSDSEDEVDGAAPPAKGRQLIKPDLSLLLSSSFELDEDEEEVNETTDTEPEPEVERTRISPTPMSPLRPLSPPRHARSASKITWQETAVDDLIANRTNNKLVRRHSITVCESPGKVSPNGSRRWPWSRFSRSRAKCIEEHAEEGQENCHGNGLNSSQNALNASENGQNASENGQNASCNGLSSSMNALRSSENRLNASPNGSPANGSTCRAWHASGPSQIAATNKRLSLSNSLMSCCSEHANGRAASSVSQELSQLNVSELMHKRWQNPVECLSLRLDEVMHIREVLTKAELEGLSTQPQLYNNIAKLKLCFTCKTTRFTLFGQWGSKCRLCKRTVCNKCLRKMHIPTEHFEKIPVYTLSPAPLSPEGQDLITKLTGTGSTPPSPVVTSTLFPHQITASSRKRRPLSRSHTITSRPPEAENLRGPQMNVCCECKNMVCEIIRVSRTSVTLASHGNDWQPSHRSRPSRDLHLDLKPV